VNNITVVSRFRCQRSAGQNNRKAKHIYWHAILVLLLAFICFWYPL